MSSNLKLSKEIMKKVKRHLTKRERMFANLVSDKRIMSEVCRTHAAL